MKEKDVFVSTGGRPTSSIVIVLNNVEPSVGRSALLAGYAALALAVSLLACAVPTWGALRVQPTEALRLDS